MPASPPPATTTCTPENWKPDFDASNRPHLLTLGMRGYTDTGVIGKPSLGSAAKGKAIIESLVESFNEHLQLLGGPR